MGYHLNKIEKGILGEYSKIVEEYQELQDANSQSNPILELVEISDLIGAIESYTLKKYGISLEQIIKMKMATQRSFESGERK